MNCPYFHKGRSRFLLFTDNIQYLYMVLVQNIHRGYLNVSFVTVYPENKVPFKSKLIVPCFILKFEFFYKALKFKS
jgi:hypothetical protein